MLCEGTRVFVCIVSYFLCAKIVINYLYVTEGLFVTLKLQY